MRVIYPTQKGSKPMRLGIKHAKRVARSADKRDQLAVLAQLGPGLPRQHNHHQQLVKMRQAYYQDQYEAREAERVRIQSAITNANDQSPGVASGEVSEPAPGADPGERDTPPG